MPTGVTIRPVTREDVPVLLRFIRELAEYEKLLHEAVGTEADLIQYLFGPSPKVEALLAEAENVPVGFCLYFHTFSTFLTRHGIYIEDLYITPDYRGSGVGGLLLKAVVAIAKQRNCGRVEWAALDWNTPAINFYTKLGARQMNEWKTFRLTEDGFDKILDL